MNKATIVSIEKNKAYVFTDECKVKKIKLRADMVLGQQIGLEPKNKLSGFGLSDSGSNIRTILLRRIQTRPVLAAAALILLVAIVMLFGLSPFVTPVYATVSVDINPSVQFDINRQLKVSSAYALNQEGETLLRELRLNGLQWQEAVRAWHQKAVEAGFTDFVLISALMPEEEIQLKEQLLQMEKDSAIAGNTQTIKTMYSHNTDVRSAAAENGLTIGRQLLFNQAHEQNRQMEIHQMREDAVGRLFEDLIPQGQRNQTASQIARQADEEQVAVRETNQETHRETINEAEQQGNQETHKETYGQHDADTDDEDQTGGQETHRETNRETTAETDQTGQESHRETNRETTGEANQTGQETQPQNREIHQETVQETTDDKQLENQPNHRETHQSDNNQPSE